jgi:hypothetical protein
MQDPPRDFTTGDFEITVEAPVRSAFMRLGRNIGVMSPAELAELSRRLASTRRALGALSRRLASTRRALAAAGYQVRHVDEPRPCQLGERAKWLLRKPKASGAMLRPAANAANSRDCATARV